MGRLNEGLVYLPHSLFLQTMAGDLLSVNEGLIHPTKSILVEMNESRIVMVDKESKRLLMVSEIDLRGIKHNTIVDLNVDGTRWEGDVLNDEPLGWGVVYDKDNHVVYEGFRLNDVNVGYGRKYYADIGVVEYDGEWLEGKRWGEGVLYDRKGDTVFKGEWLNDERLEKEMTICEKNQNFFTFHSHLEKLVIANHCYSDNDSKPIDLGRFASLRVLEIGDYCFDSTTKLSLTSLNQLEVLRIGKECFQGDGFYVHDPKHAFCVKNCASLRELIIGDDSFSYFVTWEISDNPSLETFCIGKGDDDGEGRYLCSFTMRSSGRVWS